MNWFKKSMALPFSLQRADEGAWVIDEDMREETAKQQKEKHNPSYLGAGTNGLAINIGTHAGKYTRFKEEATIANYLKNNPSECFVKIFDVQEIQKDPSIFLIEMEKCTLFSKKDESVLEFMYQEVRETEIDNIMRLNEEKIIKAYNKTIRRHPFKRRILNDYKNFLLCLVRSGFKTRDYKPSNTGYNSVGQLVLFDIGFLSTSKNNL